MDTNANGDPTSGDQSSIPAVEPSEIAKRIKLVADELIDYASKKDDSPFSSHMWFIKSIFSIFFEEMSAADDEKLGMWLTQFGVLMEWCSTGNNDLLPPEVAEYLRNFHPEHLAITAGE
jgi:hypothetical protein